MKEYVKPDFDVTIYNFDENIAMSVSIIDKDPDDSDGSGDDRWWG